MRKYFSLLLLLILLTYQGCSDGLRNPLLFQSSTKAAGLAGGGNGDGYDGKPDPGEYFRFVPGYRCAGRTQSDELVGQITVKDGKFLSEILNPDECQKVPRELMMSQVGFAPYNKLFLSHREGLYVHAKSREEYLQNPWKYEVLCRWKKNSMEGLDVMIEIHEGSRAARASVARGLRNMENLQQDNYGPMDVRRLLSPTSRSLSYQGENISLNVDLKARQSQLGKPEGTFKAQFSAVIDGKSVEHEMSCWTADQLDNLSFKLAFTGKSAPQAPIVDRVFQEELSSTWSVQGICDPEWGDVQLGGPSLDSPQVLSCSPSGKFSAEINYGTSALVGEPYTTPYFLSSSRDWSLSLNVSGLPIGGHDLRVEQGPAFRTTRIFKSSSSYPVVLISTATELKAISPTLQALYILTRDIDGAADGTGLYYWANPQYCPTGILDGNNKILSNAIFSRDYPYSGGSIGDSGSSQAGSVSCPGYGGLKYQNLILD